jgi:hypothetical protein
MYGISIPRQHSSTKARAYEPTASLSSTSKTEVKYQAAGLGVTCDQQIEYLSSFYLSRSRLQLQINKYQFSNDAG